MNENHVAFDQRFEAGKSVIEAIDLSAARRPPEESNIRGPMTLSRIRHDPAVMGGRPCIRSLRITVATILNLMASRATRERILQAYPQLEPDDIKEAPPGLCVR